MHRKKCPQARSKPVEGNGQDDDGLEVSLAEEAGGLVVAGRLNVPVTFREVPDQVVEEGEIDGPFGHEAQGLPVQQRGVQHREAHHPNTQDSPGEELAMLVAVRAGLVACHRPRLPVSMNPVNCQMRAAVR